MPMQGFEFLKWSALFGVVVIVVLTFITFSLAGAILAVARKSGVSEMLKMSAVLPSVLESLSYAEIPIAIIAVIADHKRFALNDVAAEYTKDANRRKSIVLQTFKKDPVSNTFINNFSSKFIQHGYVGEELLG